MSEVKRAPDFLRTLERMYQDSRLLFEKGEYYNCCYLCGYVLECALKFLLCRYGRKINGESYTWQDVKRHGHNLAGLNQELADCLAITDGIPPQYRLDGDQICPYIFSGRNGDFLRWDPRLRYGECPSWDTRECCQHYIEESEAIFQFIGAIISGGDVYDSL